MKRIIRTYALLVLLGCPILLSAQYFKFMDFGQTTGKSPYGSVILDSPTQTLYGMTYDGGANNYGTVFKFELEGPGFTDLMDFTIPSGANPRGSLLKSGSTLFGMTSTEGAHGDGTIFKIKTDGTGFTDLFDFNLNTNGGSPFGSLILSGNLLYGMTYDGGTNGDGVIFSVDTNGNNYTVLHHFNGTDGSGPYGELVINGNMLYGMTKYGGSGTNFGTIFKIETNGNNYQKIFTFDWVTSGGYPNGSLAMVNGDLYGMASQGGDHGVGVIFKITTSGIGYTRLLDFDASSSGEGPWGNLAYDGTSLYGMVDGNGSPDYGTIFSIATDGSNYEQIYNFTDPLKGSAPRGTPVVVSIPGGTIFYGMMFQGGGTNNGTLFKYNTLGTGISPVGESLAISVYPNPVKNNLYIRSTEMIREIRIVDLLGKVAYEGKPESQVIVIPLDNINKGIYFLRVEGTDQTIIKKFIKE